MLKPSAMSEPRCPGCNHPEPLHTMKCRWRNPLYPILTDLIEDLRDRHADCTTCYTKRALDCAEARLAAQE